VEAERLLLEQARARGTLATFGAYFKLSGPGWLQSAITLGGGSLAGSLYLGVLGGFSLMWLQPLAMVLGIIMLGAIGYVTLSTGERPFQAVNTHVSPILGWSWALATLAANMVWALPQYSLASSVLQQNLLPGLVGPDGALGDFGGKLVISAGILTLTTAVTWSYDRGGLGIRLYELMLKILVGVIVLCFFGVLFKLTFSDTGLPWGRILAGFVPNPRSIFNPAPAFEPLLEAVAPEQRAFWTEVIVGNQRDVVMAAAATAVGINMTFLFPYTLLKRGWGREFRGLALFDLSTGMFIPFVLATSCVVIAAATQFHAIPQPGFGFGEETTTVTVSDNHTADYESLLTRRLGEAAADLEKDELKVRIGEIPAPERRIAATLVKRSALDLASSLRPLTGDLIANVLFGIGVLGMTLSTITILMLISGFVICEMFNLPQTGWPYRLAMLSAATGALGPFVWSKAAFWLAVPTSIFGLALAPIAYVTFFLLMNQKKLLGDAMPSGGKRLLWNVLMGIAVVIAVLASAYAIWIKILR
jgi:Mn2+/Fe2+ NRAMP family transporter